MLMFVSKYRDANKGHVPFILYFRRPPDLSSVPSTSCAGKVTLRIRLRKYQPRFATKACQLKILETPRQPMSFFNFSNVKEDG